MSKRVFIFGIDSLDREILLALKHQLPNFSRLMDSGTGFNLEGVYPPDSPTSWASIVTGMNPAYHGVVNYVDPLEKLSISINKEISNENIVGKTFWDMAGKHDKKVCILFPLLGYPAWPVNGIMVSRSTINDSISVYPDDICIEKNLSNLKGLPGRNISKYIEYGRFLMFREFNYARQMLKKKWDLFFLYSSVLDPIQHCFWNYYDKKDPSYINNSMLNNIIPEFYKQYDDIIGELLKILENEMQLLVISDHGHIMRPIKLFNINEYLRSKGFLKLKVTGNISLHRIDIVNIFKTITMKTVSRFHLETYALSFMKTFPNAKKSFVTPKRIDWENTQAYVADLSGLKSYCYGGIKINKYQSNKNFNKITTDVINELKDIKWPDTNKKIFKTILKREDLYNGPYLERYPDIVYEMYPEYGAGWDIGGPLTAISHSHNIQPGSHRRDTPVFLSNEKVSYKIIDKMTICDIYDIVLELLNISEAS